MRAGLVGITNVWKMGDFKRSFTNHRKESSEGPEDVVEELLANLNDRGVKYAVIMVQMLATVKRVPNYKSFLEMEGL